MPSKRLKHCSRRSWLKAGASAALGLVPGPLKAEPEASINTALLRLRGDFKHGGGYDGSPATTRIMARATKVRQGKLVVRPELARPSYCSGATYLLFLQLLRMRGLVRNPALAKALCIEDIPDGRGIWGRWNANGPGVARLFHQCQLGINFEDWSRARPGDFLKIFWNKHIGRRERGHLVLLLDAGRGRAAKVRFWSSNQPGGYGEKSVPKEDIQWAIFSRLTAPQNIIQALKLPKSDRFLAQMLNRDFSRKDVRRQCGM